jgi:dihydrodiol dehydrogenase / D-xylose 1-dehydrogenase (NADP)
MKRFGWGFAGLGSIAHRFMRDLPLCPNARLAAVASRSAEKAAEFARQYGFEKNYGSYREMMADPGVDIIYVATPHSLHREIAVMAMEAGKAVLCEKALCVSAHEAAEMIACAHRNGVFFMEAMWTRFLPLNRKVKEVIAGGTLGRVTLVEADFGFGRWNGGRAPDPAARLYAAELAGGSLLDVGVYCASWASYMLGEKPVDVQAQAAFMDTGVDGLATMLLRYPGGALAVLRSAIAQATPQKAVIRCENGTVEVPEFWHASRATIRRNGADAAQTLELPCNEGGAEGFRYEIEEAMACMEKGLLESPVMPWRESLEVMETLDTARARVGLKYPFEP